MVVEYVNCSLKYFLALLGAIGLALFYLLLFGVVEADTRLDVNMK